MKKITKKIIKNILIIMIPILVIFIVMLIINKKNFPKEELIIDYNIKINEYKNINFSEYQIVEYDLNNTLLIDKPGVYKLSGTIENGNIEINTEDNIKLILNNVTITNSKGPAIIVTKASNIIIESPKDTINYLEDSKDYKGEKNATIYSDANLIFDGEGTLNIKSNNKDAIVSNNYIIMNSGTYKIDSNNTAIKGKDYIYIANGIFDINAEKDGIKSTNDTDEENGKGFIKIDAGEFKIKSEEDAISAATKLIIDSGSFNIITNSKTKYEELCSDRILDFNRIEAHNNYCKQKRDELNLINIETNSNADDKEDVSISPDNSKKETNQNLNNNIQKSNNKSKTKGKEKNQIVKKRVLKN